MNSKINTFNIIGCCVSRDSFKYGGKQIYNVGGYVFRLNPLLLFQNPISEIEITDNLIGAYCEDSHSNIPLKEELVHDFGKRTLKFIMNGGADRYLLERKGEWILLDSNYIQFSQMIYIKKSSTQEYVQNDSCDKYVDFISKIVIDAESISIVDGSINILNYIDQFAQFLSEHWGSKVIYIRSRPSEYYITNDCAIKPIHYSNISTEQEDKFYQELSKRIDLKVIDIPGNIVSRDGNPVHYITPTMEYIKKMIDSYVLSEADICRLEIKLNYLKNLPKATNLSRSEIIYYLNPTINDYWAIHWRLYKLYSGVLGESPNYELSEKHLEKAYSQSPLGCKYELLELYSQGKTPGAFSKFMKLSESLIDSKDYVAMAKISVYYNKGKGVPKNLEKALFLAEESYRNGVKWASSMVLDILLKINTTESKSKFVSLAKSLSEAGDAYAMARLGIAYRDGLGVDCNLFQYAQLEKRAASYGGVAWATREYLNALWMINTDESITNFIKLATTLSNSGDLEISVVLSRAYRYGRGVPKDLDFAIHLIKKGIPSVDWATREYFDVLLELGTECSKSEAFELAKLECEKGNVLLYSRLASCYKEGYGVDKNENLARYWSEKAK